MDPSSDTSAATATATSPTVLRRLTTIDAAISLTLHQHNFLPHAVFVLLELLADFRLFCPLALSVYLSPSLSSILHPFLTPLILGLLVDLAVVGLVKVIFRRPRPVYNKNMSVAVSVDHYSFPSGHSSRVFFVASLFCLSSQLIQEVEIVDHLVLGAWIWAVATAVSRVLLGRHFVLDVFAGSCLGILEGLFAFHYLRLSFWFSKSVGQPLMQISLLMFALDPTLSSSSASSSKNKCIGLLHLERETIQLIEVKHVLRDSPAVPIFRTSTPHTL